MALDLTHLPTTSRRGRPRIVVVAEADRQRAFQRAKRHSWLVRVLKLGLPALAVVSTGGLILSPAMLVHLYRPDVNASVGAIDVTTDQLRMVNPRFDGYTADKGHYVVTAKAAVQSFGNADAMQLEAVHGHIEQLDKSWTDLTSKSGTYQTKTKGLKLTDGIIITTSSNMRAELASADIDTDKKVVTSDSDVTMTMPNGTLRGRGLLVDDAEHRLLLREAVVAHLTPPSRTRTAPVAASPGFSAVPAVSDAPIDITAAQLEVLDNAKTATFSGTVEAVQAGIILHSAKMEIGYTGTPGSGSATLADGAAAAQNLSYITATQSVVITTPDGRKATCEQSRFDQKANTMSLFGSVVLSQKGSQLHADTVVYDLVAKTTHATAKNRIAGHFEPDSAAPAGLSGLSSAHGATDITADALDIADADNEAVFNGTVIVSQRGNRLTGDRLAIDMVKRHMAMSGPGRVSGVFEAAEGQARATKVTHVANVPSAKPSLGSSFSSLSSSNGQPTNIEADGLTVEDERGEAIFTGNVVVVRGGHRISANLLTVDYTGGGAATRGPAQLARLRARDHVVIRTPDNQTATSDWLIFEANRNLLTMGGNVTVSQGDNVVHGEKLVVDLASGESHFETRADETAGALPSTTTTSGRIQVLITPQGIRQIGGPPVAGAQAVSKPKAKSEMSASEVMVAPETPQSAGAEPSQ